MQLTISQIHELSNIIETNQAVIIGREFGPDFLTEFDKTLLERAGVDLEQLYSESADTIFTSFHFGLISDSLRELGYIDSTSYKDLYEYISRGEYIPLTHQEIASINSVKTQSLASLRSIGNKIFQDINQILPDTSRSTQEGFIRKEIEDGVKYKKTTREVANEIAHKTGDWSRDFDRIVQYTSQTAYEAGKAAAMTRQYGDDIYVYKQVYEKACFPAEDTEYLTNEGFKLLDDIRGDELVFSFNKETKKGEWSSIESKIRYHYEGTMHSYTNNTVDLVSTPNHKHLVGCSKTVNKKRIYEPTLVESSNVLKQPFRSVFYRTVDGWEGGYDKSNIEVCGKIFPTEYFAKFMGWWLSEGSVSRKYTTKNGNYVMSSIKITQLKTKNFEEIKDCFSQMFPGRAICRTESDFICNLDISYEQLIEWFIQFGKSWEKFIPQEILQLDPFYLKIFTDAYIKGDGHRGDIKTGKRGRDIGESTTIITSSKKMVDGFMEVGQKIGIATSYNIYDGIGRTSIKKCGAKVTTRRLRYTIKLLKNKYVHNLKMHFKEIINWKGVVGCLQLEKNQTLLIRRGGKLVWSGNCKHCVRLYLTSGIGSEPKIFKLSELIANGSNIGKKVADWKPTLDPIHPYCRCNLMYLSNSLNFKWDIKDKKFNTTTTPTPTTRARPKIKAIVGGKEVWV